MRARIGTLVVCLLVAGPAYGFGLGDVLKSKKVPKVEGSPTQETPVAQETPVIAKADFGSSHPEIVRLARERWGDSASNLAGVAKKFKASADDFDGRWTAYHARLKEVEAAVAAAKGLEPAAAVAKLKTVITPQTPNEKGQLVPNRKLVEVYDAERAAVLAWYELAGKQGDMGDLADVIMAVGARRQVGTDADTERLWFIAEDVDTFGSLDDGMTDADNQWVTTHEKDAHAASLARFDAARGAFEGLKDAGVAKNPYLGTADLKKGQWMLFLVNKDEFKDGGISVYANQSYEYRYDCKITNIPDYVDLVSGKIWYKESCKTKWITDVRTMKASLAEPAPAWTAGTYEQIWVVGKITAVGPKWEATDVRVIDMRFYEHRPI